jgi:hypothetical protein
VRLLTSKLADGVIEGRLARQSYLADEQNGAAYEEEPGGQNLFLPDEEAAAAQVDVAVPAAPEPTAAGAD